MKKPNIITWLISLFKRKDDLKKKRLAIIAFINAIKEAANNPIADLIVKAIPGRTDDEILEWIRKASAAVLKGLQLTENGFNSGIAVKQTIERLSEIPKSERAGYYKMIGGELYTTFTELPIDTAIEEIQKEYREWKA